MDINKIIDIIHTLKQEGGIANSVGTGGLTGSAVPPGRLDGYDKVMGFTRRSKYATGGTGSRKKWLDYLKRKT